VHEGGKKMMISDQCLLKLRLFIQEHLGRYRLQDLRIKISPWDDWQSGHFKSNVGVDVAEFIIHPSDWVRIVFELQGCPVHHQVGEPGGPKYSSFDKLYGITIVKDN